MVRIVKLIIYSFLFSFPYLLNGQVFEFEDPQVLPFNVNSDAKELLPILTPDGKTMYFSRALYSLNIGGKYAGHDIWETEQTSSGWTRATNSKNRFNTKGNDAVIGISKAGDVIYLMRTYPGKKVKGIYFTKRTKGQWSEPELIPIDGIESQEGLGFYMHPDENVLLISMKGSDSHGEEDLYISVKSTYGTWSKATNMGTTINTSGYEISPFLSEDKRSLYFSSNGHKGFGDADVFVSYRLYDSWETWTVPKNLGEKVNSKKFDAYFSLYGDTLAYFTSTRNGRYADIFTTKVREAGPEHNIIPLQDDEIDSLIGKNVARKVAFNERSTSLSANQRELLWYIATKLISQKDVRIMLVPCFDDDADITSNRLNSIIAQLAGAGIEGSRIRKTEDKSTQYAKLTEPPTKGEVRLVLIR
jgi:WD40-like Beta Propeller Repeat